MLGGEVAATSEAALASARELLERADAWRARAADLGLTRRTRGDRRPASDAGDRGLPDLPARRARALAARRSGPTAATSPTSPRSRARRRRGRTGRTPPAATSPTRTRRGRPERSGPRARRSLRRRAASIRGLLPVRLRRRPDRASTSPPTSTCRARPRLLPETLTVDEVERACSRRARPPDAACATGRSWSCCMRPGCGSARRSSLDREDLSLDGGYVRVIGKGDRERLVPVGDVALDWLGRWIDGAARPAARACTHVAPLRGGPLFLGDRGGRLARQQACAIVRGAAAAARGSANGSRRTRCATRSRRTCSRAAPTCGSSRSCSGMRVSPRPSSTRTSPASGSGRSTRGPIRGPDRRSSRPMATPTGSWRPASEPLRTRAPALVRPRSRTPSTRSCVADRGAPARPERRRSSTATAALRQLLGWVVAGPRRRRPRLVRLAGAASGRTRSTSLTNRRVIQAEGVLNKTVGGQLAREDQRRGPDRVACSAGSSGSATSRS